MRNPVPLARGYIAAAPVGGEVDVVLVGFDEEQRFHDLPYMPRGSSQPTVGAQCLVAFDDQGGGWVIAWEAA